jgi:PEP-CTERM motif
MTNLQSRLFSGGARKGAAFSASLLIWAVAALTTPVASADIMFTNFGAGDSYDASTGNAVGNFFDGNNYAQGGTFVASETQKLTSISVALGCFFACPDDFTISLHADSSDMPGASLEAFDVSGAKLGAFGNNNPPVQVTSVLMPILTAGKRYWVTVSSPDTDSIEWNLNSTGDTSDEAISTDGATTWFSPSGLTPGAFEVVATPEPTSLLLLGTLLSGFALRKRLSRN